MKYTLFGFSQAKAIEYGLDDRDLLILRWFVDNSRTMDKKEINGNIYYLINYESIYEYLPIRKWKKDKVYKRLKKMVKQGLLFHETISEDGKCDYYNFNGEKYIKLLTNNEEEF